MLTVIVDPCPTERAVSPALSSQPVATTFSTGVVRRDAKLALSPIVWTL
jgi:hypothetical protein